MIPVSSTSPPWLLVGTCGFAEAQSRTFCDFDLIEVQQTFYQPPGPATATCWRNQAPADFLFTLKAWQLITHESTSPTYRRLREPLGDADLARAGDFRWNGVTRMAWARTRAIADALGAKAVLFQTPRNFQPSVDNVRRLRRFFERIDRGALRMVFEPRGDGWKDELLNLLVEDLDLVHAVDPFLRNPVSRNLHYFRLHGRPDYPYHYRYTDDDLLQLEDLLTDPCPTWVLFNNTAMADDARRFIARMRRG